MKLERTEKSYFVAHWWEISSGLAADGERHPCSPRLQNLYTQPSPQVLFRTPFCLTCSCPLSGFPLRLWESNTAPAVHKPSTESRGEPGQPSPSTALVHSPPARPAQLSGTGTEQHAGHALLLRGEWVHSDFRYASKTLSFRPQAKSCATHHSAKSPPALVQRLKCHIRGLDVRRICGGQRAGAGNPEPLHNKQQMNNHPYPGVFPVLTGLLRWPTTRNYSTLGHRPGSPSGQDV